MASANPTPCWYCRHFQSFDRNTGSAKYGRGANPETRQFPRNGCADFLRETGVDDDDWEPARALIAPYTPPPPPGPRLLGNDGWWTEPRRPRPQAAVAAQHARLAIPTFPPGQSFEEMFPDED